LHLYDTLSLQVRPKLASGVANFLDCRFVEPFSHGPDRLIDVKHVVAELRVAAPPLSWRHCGGLVWTLLISYFWLVWLWLWIAIVATVSVLSSSVDFVETSQIFDHIGIGSAQEPSEVVVVKVASRKGANSLRLSQMQPTWLKQVKLLVDFESLCYVFWEHQKLFISALWKD